MSQTAVDLLISTERASLIFIYVSFGVDLLKTSPARAKISLVCDLLISSERALLKNVCMAFGVDFLKMSQARSKISLVCGAKGR